VFEQLRRSLDELLERATKPEDRRAVMARMKSTLVQARLGVDDLRDALEQSRRKLEREQSELLTVRRRKDLASGINDAETVAVAERFERQHEEKARILAEKIAIQERELGVAERELEEMKADLRKAMAGVGPGPAPAGAAPLEEPPAGQEPDPLGDPEAARVRQEIDRLARARARADRDADADRRLEELKRKMGK